MAGWVRVFPTGEIDMSWGYLRIGNDGFPRGDVVTFETKKRALAAAGTLCERENAILEIDDKPRKR